MNEPKIYVPGACKEIKTRHGGILKLNMPVEELKQLIEEHQQNGWITFSISPRREVGAKGQTHSVWVDKWKPEEKSQYTYKPTQQEAPASKPNPQPELPGDDVPF